MRAYSRRPAPRTPSEDIDWLLDSYFSDPHRDRRLDSFARDPEVIAWLKDYWSYVCWMEHGNQASVYELEGESFEWMLADISGLSVDPYTTEYLVNDEPSSEWIPEQRDLIVRRRKLQRKYRA